MVQLLRPYNVVVTVEASVFHAHVVDSPRVLSFTSNVVEESLCNQVVGGNPQIVAQVEDSVLDITNRCFPDATALAVRLEDLDPADREEDFYSRVGSV